jgi:hypothetical protein
LSHEDFIGKWQAMEPLFNDAEALRPAVFLSRDVMAPARSRSDLSEAARAAVEALLKVDSANSPVGKKIVEELPAGDRRAVMSHLIGAMREKDWSAPVPGIHGALILAKASTEASLELEAFTSGLQTAQMDKGIRYILKMAGMIDGGA